MKVLLVLGLMLLAAATAIAYGPTGVSAVSAVASHASTEPTAMLLSGSVLLGIAGAVRRLPL